MTAQMEAAIVGGLISGALVLTGVLVSELSTRNRERTARRELLIAELEPRLLAVQQFAAPGRILAVSPGSSEGASAKIEVLATFGIVHEALSTVAGARWGWRKDFRDQCLALGALLYLAAMEPPLNDAQVKQLNTLALRDSSGPRRTGKGFDAALSAVRTLGTSSDAKNPAEQ